VSPEDIAESIAKMTVEGKWRHAEANVCEHRSMVLDAWDWKLVTSPFVLWLHNNKDTCPAPAW
jgi:hypothetical protein